MAKRRWPVPTFESVLRAALELPPADRERLVAEAVDTLDEDLRTYEAAWDDEIARRLEELELGDAELMDSVEAKKLIVTRA